MPYFGDVKREYQRQWVANRRKKYFSDKVCFNCGSKDNLELHHINPNDKIANSIWSWSKQKQDQELKKCIVLCGTCHKAETKRYRRRNLTHGMITMYKNGCRCRECLESNRQRVMNGIWLRKKS